MNTDNHLPKDNSSVPGRTNDPETFAKFASVKSYQDYLTDKDNPVVMVTLTVNDQGFLDNTTFETYLTQHTNAHDEFTIVVSDTAIDDFYGQVMRNSKNLLGEPITIHIHHEGAVVQSFKGIIAQVSDKRNEGGGYGNLHISGYGLSIFLDSGEECQSYEDKTLPEIIAEATNEYGDVKVNTKGMVNTKYKIPYVVQYKESDYQFIQRLARRYGEFFFYDGTQLQFNNETRQTVQLSEGDDLIEVAFELKIQPQHFSYLSYGIEKGEVEEKNTKNVHLQDKGNPFQFAAVKASEKVFTKKTKVPYNAFTEEFRGDYLADNVRREKESREQLMEVRGRSRNPNLRIGGFVKLKDINDKPMESYRIIDIKHHQSGYDYENEFVAIPDVYIAYYYDREALPRAEQQIARVTDNNDPKGLGRVRVQFIWQVAKKLQTPWIRVVQPHAGSGKGFYFIPEIGEEVLVDFEDQNAERPFVVGSHYNGKEYSPFHNTNNDVKAIQTRSGVIIKINDRDGSLFLEDPSGNSIYMDGKQKISFNGSILEFNAQRIVMNATERTEITTNDYILKAVNKIKIIGIWFEQKINGFMQIFSNKALIKSSNIIDIEAKEAKLYGATKSILHSDNIAIVNSKGIAELKGKEGNRYNHQAEEIKSHPEEEIGLAVVHFRPKSSWKGEFGFDWLRVNDGKFTKEKPYEEIILGDYQKGVLNFGTEQNKTDAYKHLKNEYYSHKIIRREGSTIFHTEYFSPYLSLYSKETVDRLPKTLLVKPQYEVELKVLIEIEEDLKELKFEYDTKLFELSRETLSTKKTSLKRDGTIRIICKQDIKEDTRIKVYAYPKENSDENCKLAGEIIVLKNDKNTQKKEKIVLVPVRTNIKGRIRVGFSNRIERKISQKILYQGFIESTIELGEELDLSSDANFKIISDSEGNKKYGKFIFKKEDPSDLKHTGDSINQDEKEIYEYVKKIYLLKYPKYKDFFTIFCFNENTYDSYSYYKFEIIDEKTQIKKDNGSVPGQTESIGTRNVFLFMGLDENNRTKNTMIHEILHGLGLCHTHYDDPMGRCEKIYIYPNGNEEENIKFSTDNIMSYGQKETRSLWYWQLHFINSDISEKKWNE